MQVGTNPQRTKIVYCRDANRRGNYPEQNFDFLSHPSRPCAAMNGSGQMFVSFIPAVGAKATNAMHSVLRQWKFSHRGDLALCDGCYG
jgi:RNA-directed DNA polymerase